MNIVWFKRDLRVQDHLPLLTSLNRGPTVALFIFEPKWFHSAEFHSNHLLFALQCLDELKENLKSLGIDLLFRSGSATEVFQQLHSTQKISKIFSHEETGLLWTYERDKEVKIWCRQHSIEWQEFSQFGVIRGLKNRDEWNAMRLKIIERPSHKIKGQIAFPAPWKSETPPYHLLQLNELKKNVQKGGRKAALQTLSSFLDYRGELYLQSLSSPNTAFEHCSRLSPYITWGAISLTEVHHELTRKKAGFKGRPWQEIQKWKRSVEHFENRLWWHCHFIQKLESEPEIEFNNFNRGFDQLRESEFCEKKFQAWCRGETGVPFIDACMRALLEHGWINFRMRAMLMSFSSYQLWLHWKKPAEHLARHFIDFEPGIHYSQVQMQSGVTGINSIRIYSPYKQQFDLDPQGIFTRRYVTELKNAPNEEFLSPQEIPPLFKFAKLDAQQGGYPPPIVDPIESYRCAKEKIFNWKKKLEVRELSNKVLHKHGSRKHSRFPVQKRD